MDFYSKIAFTSAIVTVLCWLAVHIVNARYEGEGNVPTMVKFCVLWLMALSFCSFISALMLDIWCS